MSGTPDAGSDSQGFTCGALLMCLYLPGLSSKKKPEAEAAAATTGPAESSTAPVPNDPAEKAPPDAPSRAASLEKSECASLYSGSNIVFDFAVEELEGGRREEHGGGARGFEHGYCPSPCFDLPVELIRAGERFGTGGAAERDTPVTAAFVFGDGGRGGHRGGGALQKVASCLTPAGAEGDGDARLVRFLSASGRSSVAVARPPVMVMPSRAAPHGEADE
ncbi:unnamed protein product [Urochloa decumbens]|uniref:Uncharacterized protein n=1 Tax=Urochloa decumbens TaxID=240449 RepID=A0ABC8ZFQ2_9POAL